LPMTTLDAIDTANRAIAADDNSRTGPGDATLLTPYPDFSEPLPNGGSAPEPSVVVKNDFTAGHVSSTEIYPWPDIIVVGAISNLGGLVHLETKPAGEGNITITASVEAKTLEIISGGTVFINLGDIPGSKFNVGSEPFTQWNSITQGTVPGGDGTLFDGLGSATDVDDDGIDDHDLTDVNNLLAQVPTTPGVYGDRVYILAEYINVDGLLQSGKDTYDLTLGTNTANEISTLGTGGGLVELHNADVEGGDFIVRYNTGTHQIEVDDLRIKGGYVDLTGH